MWNDGVYVLSSDLPSTGLMTVSGSGGGGTTRNAGVNFSTADGTARVSDGDYVVPSPLSVTISAGNTSGTISVSTLDDLFCASTGDWR